MRLKSDDISIDSLATSCSTEDLSRTLATLETVKTRKLSDGTEIDKNIAVLREAIKRQTESKIYMFDIYDWLAEIQSWNVLGVWIYRRTWNKLENQLWLLWDNIDYDNILDYVKRREITEVFTWSIERDFLWIPERFDDTHGDEDYVVEVKVLTPQMIDLLRNAWVNVRVLNILA